MTKYNVLLPIFLVSAAAVTAVIVQNTPSTRLIPADVLRGKNIRVTILPILSCITRAYLLYKFNLLNLLIQIIAATVLLPHNAKFTKLVTHGH